jgi:hypothetical protein
MEFRGQLHAVALTPGKNPAVLIGGWGPHSWFDRHGEKELLLLPEIEPRFLGLPARSLVAVPTEPSLLICRMLLTQASSFLFLLYSIVNHAYESIIIKNTGHNL